MIDLLEKSEQFIVFVGAGASSLPPSKLPTWTEFNTLLLECLCDRLAEYSDSRQPTDHILATFRARRDNTRLFAPDFQAQLMEEEIGAEYFRVWQSLETSAVGPVHSGLAELASRGRLAAIITTNFDRLIETALGRRGIEFEVYYDRDTFEHLPKSGALHHSATLPVIKLHGSIQHSGSLVDTLRQRVVGRPESLMKALRVLLREFPWLYLGFSGADFSYDPHYLGILDAATDAKGFVFLARTGNALQSGVSALSEAYGREKAAIVVGDLSSWLSDSFNLSAPNLDANPAAVDNGGVSIQDRIRCWVTDLGNMAVVNIVSSLLKSSGMDSDAHWLLRKTWRTYRSAEDVNGVSYPRYNYNYGMALQEAGFLTNRVALESNMSNADQWKEYADQSAYQFFARSYQSGRLPAAGGQMASVLAYRGELAMAVTIGEEATDAALARNDALELCDIAIASVVIFDILRLFDPAIGQLRRHAKLSEQVGDEPRRAMLNTHLGRFLTYRGQFEEADKCIKEADRIATRLGLKSVFLACRAARGRWLSDTGDAAEAVRVLSEVVEAIHALDDEVSFTQIDLLNPEGSPRQVEGHSPTLCRVLLDLNGAALSGGERQIVDKTFDRLDELTTQLYLGYCPHYYLAYAESLLIEDMTHDQCELFKSLINSARELGERSNNPWVKQASEMLRVKARQGQCWS